MNCSKCNNPLNENDAFCSHCGAFVSQESPKAPTLDETTYTPAPDFTEQPATLSAEEAPVTPAPAPPYTQVAPPWANSTMPSDTPPPVGYNFTTQNPYAPPKTPYVPGTIPTEIKKWNWGAFMYNIYWGIGNHSYLPLLCLIPIFNFVWIFVCGAKGNEWAWKSGKFNNVEDFMATQATWNRAGLFGFLLGLAGFIFAILYYILVLGLTFANY